MDYKKEFKELYQPKTTPCIIDVPAISFFAVDGTGDPNEEDGLYQKAVGLLYALSFTIKMSKIGDSMPDGYFEYTVPPLEGFWCMDGGKPGIDYAHKEQFKWTTVIRQPEFVTPDVFSWACTVVEEKKGIDTSLARFETITEGLCVHCMHIGPFDSEPATVEKMNSFIAGNGLVTDFSEARRHHEIYLGDPRKCKPERLKTIIRHPVRYASDLL